MKVTCSQKELHQALSAAGKVIDSSNSLPVLNNVLLKSEGKKILFAGTNLEMALSYWIEAKVVNEGSITLPARLFSGYIACLGSGDVDMTLEDGQMLIQTKGSKTRIKGIAAGEFPPIPVVEKEGYAEIDSMSLSSAIRQVAFAAALSTTRPVLGGVYFVVQGDQLKMVATDSYRLAERSVSIQKPSGRIECIVPARTVLELGAILDNLKAEEAPVQMIVSKNQILFRCGPVELLSRLVEGQFPNYAQIIPKNEAARVECTTKNLTAALRQISIFARENNNKVILKISPESLLLTTDSTPYGEGEVMTEVKTQGANAEIALNAQFILELLSNLASEKVVLEIGDKNTPVIFRPVSKDAYLHLIMPLKL